MSNHLNECNIRGNHSHDKLMSRDILSINALILSISSNEPINLDKLVISVSGNLIAYHWSWRNYIAVLQ